MFDEDLAERVRMELAPTTLFTERKMFGGLAFMIGGNMACGVVGDELMVRTGPERYPEALTRPHARPVNFTGRPMTGMLFVGTAGLEGGNLGEWIAIGAGYARGLPAKGGGSVRPRKR